MVGIWFIIIKALLVDLVWVWLMSLLGV
jgi:hypothetical protein